MAFAKSFGLLAAFSLAWSSAAFAAQATPPQSPSRAHATAAAKGPDPALLRPSRLTAKAPGEFRVKFTTTKGVIIVEVRRDWAPRGADRFYNLVLHHFYDQASFFRVLKDPHPFVAQFGINADPKLNAAWQAPDATINDDPVTQTNARGTVTFATGGPNTRTTQLFINLGDNKFLDASGFSPFGQVVEGMDVVDKLNGEYGEGAPRGRGPDQNRIQAEGKTYLDKNFPRLDSVVTGVLLPAEGTAPARAAGKSPAKPE